MLVPVYPPGLSLMMAPLTLIHRERRVPAGAVVRRADGVADGPARTRARPNRRRACSGRCCVAVSPTFLLQAVQPMSDVPVAALWLSALILARRPTTGAAILAGVVSSLAILDAAEPGAAGVRWSPRRRATVRRAPDRPRPSRRRA